MVDSYDAGLVAAATTALADIEMVDMLGKRRGRFAFESARSLKEQFDKREPLCRRLKIL